jgi:hypothetical protein
MPKRPLLAHETVFTLQPSQRFVRVAGQPIAALALIAISLFEPASGDVPLVMPNSRTSCACALPLVRASRIASARNSGE